MPYFETVKKCILLTKIKTNVTRSTLTTKGMCTKHIYGKDIQKRLCTIYFTVVTKPYLEKIVQYMRTPALASYFWNKVNDV